MQSAASGPGISDCLGQPALWVSAQDCPRLLLQHSYEFFLPAQGSGFGKVDFYIIVAFLQVKLGETGCLSAGQS